MEMGKNIIQLLDNEIIAGGKIHNFTTERAGKLFNITVADKDKFSYLFAGIDIKNRNFENKLQQSELEERAKTLCEKVTYLGEDLDIIEIDSTKGVVLSRSKLDKNVASQKEINYFELVLSCEKAISLNRYNHNRQTKLKTERTFHFTKEVAEKFLNHLHETIA